MAQQTKKVKDKGLGMAGNTFEHQNIIKFISNNLAKRFPSLEKCIRSKINVIPKKGTKDKHYPDITIWKKIIPSWEKLPKSLYIMIEITNSNKNDKDALNCIIETYAKNPTLKEAFIYNYKKKTWKRYINDQYDGIIEAGEDFSEELGINLNILLYEDIYYLRNDTFKKYDDYCGVEYSAFGADKMEIISKIRNRLALKLPEKDLHLRDDIKLYNHLTPKGEFIPVVSYWKEANYQENYFFLRKMRVLIEVTTDYEEAYLLAEDSFDKCAILREILIYNATTDIWTRCTYDDENIIVEENCDKSSVLKLHLQEIVGLL